MNSIEDLSIEYVKNSEADIKLLIGCDTTHTNNFGMIGDNIITYLSRLIDIIRKNQSNITKLPKYIKKYNIISIENPLQYSFIDFSKENITNGFQYGIDSAEEFAKTHILNI